MFEIFQFMQAMSDARFVGGKHETVVLNVVEEIVDFELHGGDEHGGEVVVVVVVIGLCEGVSEFVLGLGWWWWWCRCRERGWFAGCLRRRKGRVGVVVAALLCWVDSRFGLYVLGQL